MAYYHAQRACSLMCVCIKTPRPCFPTVYLKDAEGGEISHFVGGNFKTCLDLTCYTLRALNRNQFW